MKILFALFAVCLFAADAHAVVTLNAAGSSTECEGTTPVTCAPITIAAGSNIGLVVISAVGGAQPSTTTATWNGVSMGTALGCTHDATDSISVCAFCLANPATGNLNLVVTDTQTGAEVHANAIAFNGVNQSTPCINYAQTVNVTGTTGSVTVTSVSGDYVVAGQANGFVNIGSTNQTQVSVSTSCPAICMSMNYAAGTGSGIAMTGNSSPSTSGSWDAAGIDVSAAAGGTPASLMGILMVSASLFGIGILSSFGLHRRFRNA